MLIDCAQHESDRVWIWIIFGLNILGASLYFVLRYLPRMQGKSIPGFPAFSRWNRREELWRAEADARNIGKAHQFIKLGELLGELGEKARSESAYDQALTLEPHNPKALWGKATLATGRQDWAEAETHLATLYQKEADFLYGDAALAYGRVLWQQQKWDVAETHLQTHIKRWSHPEAYVLLAQIYHDRGRTPEGRQLLETMIAKVRSSPPYHYRKNRGIVNEGERLLKRWSKES